MTLQRKVLKGALSLGTGQILSQSSSFIRNFIVARMISPDNFGIAATFWITIALLDMLSNMNVELLLTQADDGNEVQFQKTAQCIQAIRGVACAATIFLLAWPVSQLFGVQQARWAFQWLAAYPLVRGFTHLDVSRFQREMRFSPFILIDVISQVVVVLAAWPLAIWLRDYSVLLWLLVAQGTVYVIGTHLVAERKYGWAWDKIYTRRIFKFGWPLLISSVLLFLVSQGDQFLIGSADRIFPHASYTLKDLGVYSLALTLTITPTVFLGKINSSLFLPVLSRTKLSGLFISRYQLCVELLSFVGCAIAIVWIILGDGLIFHLYGPNYLGAGHVIGWLAALQAVRLMRIAPGTATLAKGDPHNSMIANFCRSTVLLGALYAAAVGKGLAWIAAIGLLGEILAATASLFYMRWRHAIPLSISVRPFAYAGIMLLVSALFIQRGLGTSGWLVAYGTTFLMITVLFIVWIALFPRFRQNLVNSLSEMRGPSALSFNEPSFPIVRDTSDVVEV